MAAPTLTARTPPSGIKLREGFSTVVAFSRNPSINLFERSTQPPSVDNGEPIDNTTQFNTTWRTMRPRTLISSGPHTFKFLYDPACYDEIVALCGKEGSITEHLPDGSTLSYFGYLQKAEFDELEEGKEPSGTATIMATHYDPENHVEAGPVLVSVAGT